MFLARKVMFVSSLILAIIYFTLISLLLNGTIYFDYFYCSLLFFGIYLLVKSICYYSDSSFFLGSILFLIGLVTMNGIYSTIWIIYPTIVSAISFFTYIFFDSKLMKIVFYCSIGINIITFFIYFLS